MIDPQMQSALSAMLRGDFDAYTAEMEARGKVEAAVDHVRMKAEADIVRRAIDTPDGRKFLEWLIGKTYLRGPGVAQMSAVTAEAYAIEAAKREGENRLVATILDALKFARGESKEMPDAQA